MKLKRGKAADIFELSAEHLIFSHPAQSICGHSKVISSYPCKWLRASRIQNKLHSTDPQAKGIYVQVPVIL